MYIIDGRSKSDEIMVVINLLHETRTHVVLEVRWDDGELIEEPLLVSKSSKEVINSNYLGYEVSDYMHSDPLNLVPELEVHDPKDPSDRMVVSKIITDTDNYKIIEVINEGEKEEIVVDKKTKNVISPEFDGYVLHDLSTKSLGVLYNRISNSEENLVILEIKKDSDETLTLSVMTEASNKLVLEPILLDKKSLKVLNYDFDGYALSPLIPNNLFPI